MLKLKPEDITSELCRRCAECCRSIMTVQGDLRNLEFMEKIHGDRLAVTWRGPCSCGCGAMKFAAEITTVCPSLGEEEGAFDCRDYEERPQFCRDYNCATWLLVQGHETSPHIEAAGAALLRLRGAVTN